MRKRSFHLSWTQSSVRSACKLHSEELLAVLLVFERRDVLCAVIKEIYLKRQVLEARGDVELLYEL